jgi:uncharacterized DUF497 family protein
VEFEWDENKNRVNVRKHGISFEEAIEVFLDPLQNSVRYHHVDGEERWQTVGMVDGRLILVVHTDRKNHDGTQIIRIISARRPERTERRFYEEGGDH